MLRTCLSHHVGAFDDGPHLFMSVRDCTVPKQFLPVEVVAAKFEQFQQAEPLGDKIIASKPIGLLHHNVQTRDQVKQELYTSQLRRNSIVIATCPESRIKVTDVRMEFGFILATSACTKGGYGGCSIWIDSKASVATCDDVDMFVGLEAVCILHADSRRLIVRICSPGLTCTVACLHALDANP